METTCQEQQILKQEKQALKNVMSWKGAGKEAFKLAQKVERAKANGEVMPVTKKNLEITIKGAIKQFLDGNISGALKLKLEKEGLDMNRIRQQITEETLVTALKRIAAEGDIERLVALGEIAGEPKEENIPTNAKKVVRERVEIIIQD